MSRFELHQNNFESSSFESLPDLSVQRFHSSELAAHIEKRVVEPSESTRDLSSLDLEHQKLLGRLSGERLANQRILDVGKLDSRDPIEVLQELNGFWKRHRSWIIQSTVHLSTFIQQCVNVAEHLSAEEISQVPGHWRDSLEFAKDSWANLGWRELANTAYALTKLDAFDPESLQDLQYIILERLEGSLVIPRDMPNLFDLTQIAWSFAKNRAGSSQFWDKIAEYMIPRLHEADPDMTTTILQSFLWAGKSPENLLKAIEQKLEHPEQSLSYDNLILQLYLLGAHGQLNREWVARALPELTESISSLKSEQLAMLASVCRMSDVRNEHFLRTLGDELAYHQRSKVTLDELIYSSRAFASLNYYHDGLIELMTRKATQSLQKRENVDISRIVDAYFTLGQMNVISREFQQECLTLFIENMPMLLENEIARVLWASAVVLPDQQLRELWEQFTDHAATFVFDEIQVTQIYQASIARDMPIAEGLLSEALALDSIRFSEPYSSYFESQIKQALEALGAEFDQQYLEKGYFIDFVIYHGDHKIALECDGDPFHYRYSDSSQGLNGRSHLKQLVLEKMGYQVVRLPYSEWLYWHSLADCDPTQNLSELLIKSLFAA